MISIIFPDHSFKIKTVNEREIIFDECRKIWVSLTPEEWVRQNFLQYLLQVKHYPASLLAIEKEITLGDLKKRFDIVVYKNSRPWLLVECKEMKISINEAVLKQILNYNITLDVQYLVLTNGLLTYGLHLANGSSAWLHSLPDYNN